MISPYQFNITFNQFIKHFFKSSNYWYCESSGQNIVLCRNLQIKSFYNERLSASKNLWPISLKPRIGHKQTITDKHP